MRSYEFDWLQFGTVWIEGIDGRALRIHAVEALGNIAISGKIGGEGEDIDKEREETR